MLDIIDVMVNKRQHLYPHFIHFQLGRKARTDDYNTVWRVPFRELLGAMRLSKKASWKGRGGLQLILKESGAYQVEKEKGLAV